MGRHMEPWHHDNRATIYHGDCRQVLAALPDSSVDSVVTDPPYELGFMGKRWDASGIAYDVGLWAEALRVLKPGGHLLAFGGTRTWHRLAVAVEDAGFEVRDSIAWLYGSGFPKSLDVSKAIDRAEGIWRGRAGAAASGSSSMSGPNYERAPKGDPVTPDAARWQGWGTALKPAFEPVVVARKPLTGTVAANVLEHGTGALNIDGCRIGMTPEDRANIEGRVWVKRNRDLKAKVFGDYATDGTDQAMSVHPSGRWPANVALDEDQAAALDQQSGVSVSRIGKPRGAASGAGWGMTATGSEYADTGRASRFFYVAKAPAKERPKVDGVAHPTVKPLTLMRWLCRLVTPPGGTVLEPFAGSGTTIEAALKEGFRVVAVERVDDYLPLIAARLERIGQEPDGQLTLDASA